MSKINILFVCYGNACRSVMAENLANYFYGETAVADSAGTHEDLPHIYLDVETMKVMRELGIDIAKHEPKSIEVVTGFFDVVINMSRVDNEVLRSSKPNLQDATWIFWDVPDPRGKPIEAYSRVREMLKEKIALLLKE